jgi:hypothetical protein
MHYGNRETGCSRCRVLPNLRTIEACFISLLYVSVKMTQLITRAVKFTDFKTALFKFTCVLVIGHIGIVRPALLARGFRSLSN